VRDLRRTNRARTLLALYLRGAMTRAEIGEATNVSIATVSNVVGELLAQGVVMEAGADQSDGGRPRGLLKINPDYGYVVGVDVGETGVLVELFDLQMRVLTSHSSAPASGAADVDEVTQHVLNGLDKVVTRSGVAREAILGVGVGVPGVVSHDEDAVVDAPTIGWRSVPLGQMLRAGTNLPLLLENGSKALGQAEKWFGAARGADNAVIVLFGSGVGTCIITSGELYQGSSSSAGEWGHTKVMVGGRTCPCGAKGCLEAYVGARGIIARYDELHQRPAADDPDDLVARINAIVSSRDTDVAAAQVLDETILYLGAGIADLVNLFNPELIVVGGWVARRLGERILPDIRRVAKEHALRLPYSQVSIVPAQLGADAVALGAATLPVRRFLETGAVAPTRTRQSRRTAPVA
jgi:predicted NBD/HSP70 family sugar kinase